MWKDLPSSWRDPTYSNPLWSGLRDPVEWHLRVVCNLVRFVCCFRPCENHAQTRRHLDSTRQERQFKCRNYKEGEAEEQALHQALSIFYMKVHLPLECYGESHCIRHCVFDGEVEKCKVLFPKKSACSTSAWVC